MDSSSSPLVSSPLASGASAEALRATLTQTAIHSITAPPHWRSVEFISDLHLQPALPRTVQAWQQYLASSTADAIFLLGDLFDAWVGDDALSEPDSAETSYATTLQAATKQRPLFFIHGNRDFLIGNAFAQCTGVHLLPDPSCLHFAGQYWLLSHGDALCVDDTPYQQFRAVARNPAWQEQVLAQPLAQRRQLAGSIRNESEARKMREVISAEVDSAATLQWLQASKATTLIHGHTHRPATHQLDATHQRVVLSDWDCDEPPARAEVLRISQQNGMQRIALNDYLAHPPRQSER